MDPAHFPMPRPGHRARRLQVHGRSLMRTAPPLAHLLKEVVRALCIHINPSIPEYASTQSRNTTMALTIALVACILATTASADTKTLAIKEKYQAEEARAFETSAQDALGGVYTECFSQVSFSCLQRKVLHYVHRMSRMDHFNVLGQYLSVVKVRDENENENEFHARVATAEQENSLDQLMENTIDRFFNNHVIRVKLPSALVVRGAGRSTDSIDLQFPVSDEAEGRKKGGGGGKMGKKMMMMMMMGLKAKMMMLGPMMMGMAGLMAMKALIFGVVSLTISKIMIIKKLLAKKGGGGGGGGGHSSGGWDSGSSGGGGGWSSGGGGGGGGGGWDRRSSDYMPRSDDGWDASDLAYRAYSTVENLL